MKMVALTTLLVLLVGLGVYLFWFNKGLIKKENPEQLVKEENQAGVAENYSPTGAIAKAQMLLEGKSFRDEAYQLFGLNVWSFEEDTYLQFKGRIFANGQLNSVLQNAKKENVGMFFENGFRVGVGYVTINVSATDEEIVGFLNKSVPIAKAKKADFEELKKEGSQYGLTLLFLSDEKYYRQIRSRWVANKDLASALRAAARAKVTVYLDNEFLVRKGSVTINVSATDKEIIKFLLGK